jgi:hypothetical protein
VFDHENDDMNWLPTNANETPEITFSMIKDPTPAQTLEERNRLESIREDIICHLELNRKQAKSFKVFTENIVKRQLKEEVKEQIIMTVLGEGGTGKSWIIDSVKELHKRLKINHTLKIAAVTGTAAKHIGGSTTASLFGTFNDVKQQQNQKSKLEYRFRDTETCIIDEIGCVGACHMSEIGTALSLGKNVDVQHPFGGVDMLFTGDFWQFPPVLDSSLANGWSDDFKRPTNRKSELKKQVGINLWKQVNRVCILDQQMRCEDQCYIDFVHRLREGLCTNEDIDMLNQRVVGQEVDITSILDVPIIAPGNQLVTAVNNLFTSKHSQERLVYVCHAEDYTGRKENRKCISKRLAKIIEKSR